MLLFAVLSMVVGIDFYTKYMVTQNMFWGESIPVIPEFLNLTYMGNPGIAFGFMATNQSPWKILFYLVVLAVAVVFIMRYYLNAPRNAVKIKLTAAAALGGAFGNMIDRLRFGEVVDFIHIYWNKYYLPVFNIADVCLFIGMIMLVYYSGITTRRCEIIS